MTNYCTAPSKHPIHCGCDVGLMDCADQQKVAMSKMSEDRKAFAADMRTLKDVTGAIEHALECFDGEVWWTDEACSGINLESLFTVWKLGRASGDPKGSFAKHMEYMERCAGLQKTINVMNTQHLTVSSLYAAEVRNLKEVQHASNRQMIAAAIINVVLAASLVANTFLQGT